MQAGKETSVEALERRFVGTRTLARTSKKKGVEVYGESQLEELVNDRPFFFSI